MCGKPNKVATTNDECQKGLFETEEGQKLDGTFCECRSDGCNDSPKHFTWNKNHIIALPFFYIYLK